MTKRPEFISFDELYDDEDKLFETIENDLDICEYATSLMFDKFNGVDYGYEVELKRDSWLMYITFVKFDKFEKHNVRYTITASLDGHDDSDELCEYIERQIAHDEKWEEETIWE